MDEATQQNSALVAENAATAKMLEQQARTMDDCVAFFKLGSGAAAHAPAPDVNDDDERLAQPPVRRQA
jgi:methyl-accepting chemotaxis protein